MWPRNLVVVSDALSPGALLVEFVNGLPVVTPARLYADLLAIGGRGQDGAQHLRGTQIEF